MTTLEIRCSTACPGIEVITEPLPDGAWLSTIHGGRLDGERYRAEPDADVDSHHERVCRLARMAAWQPRPVRTRGRRRS